MSAHVSSPGLQKPLLFPFFTVWQYSGLRTFFVLPTFSYQLLAIYHPFSLPLPPLDISHGQISVPFSNIVVHKDFTFYNTSNCGFSPSSSFKSRARDMEDLQLSMGRQYGHPSCLHRRQNVVLTNPQMYFSFFSSFCESFSLLIVFSFPCMKMQLCGWQSAHCLPVFEQLACPGPVPDAVLFLSFFFLRPPACLPLFTLVMSRLLPLSRLQHRNPRREEGQEGA